MASIFGPENPNKNPQNQDVEKHVGRNPEITAGVAFSLDDPEHIPCWNRCEGEQLLGQHKNAWIVLGSDRFASCRTGYGGRGSHRASSIDLVVGRASYTTDKPDKDIIYDTNFKTDAARVYISQRADIDRYFNLDIAANGNSNSIGRSCVGIKADAVRIVGREGIKFVTRTESKNSLKGKIEKVPGIEIIAGNDPDDLQPMVKADNLARGLQKLADLISQIVWDIKLTQMAIKEVNKAVGQHVHVVPTFIGPQISTMGLSPYGGPLAVASTMANALIKFSGNDLSAVSKRLGIGWKTTYTRPMGQYYLGSQYNKVN
jgi:hypothetical protein